ncbi:hypothetical protein JW796_04630 [Candidatus Dojkabacteria bacterium]|nr:hypothetical protein [Candidatus Dojkabacteria bacterium]
MADDTQQNNQLQQIQNGQVQPQDDQVQQQDSQENSQAGQINPQIEQVGVQESADLFPSFLNDQAGVKEDFDLSKMSGLSENGTGGNKEENKSKFIGGGNFSPEISSGAVSVEAQPIAVEYGTEVQTSVEAPEIKKAENKEKKQQQDKPEIPEKPVFIQKSKEPSTEYEAPALFGYVVPPKVMQEFKAIRNLKDKGAPDSAKTWLYVLLDRLLKMHSQKPS